MSIATLSPTTTQPLSLLQPTATTGATTTPNLTYPPVGGGTGTLPGGQLGNGPAAQLLPLLLQMMMLLLQAVLGQKGQTANPLAGSTTGGTAGTAGTGGTAATPTGTGAAGY